MKLRIYFALLFLLFSLAACGGDDKAPDDPLKNFKANKAELGENWQQFRHDADQGCWHIPDGTPQPAVHYTPSRARVFWDGDVLQEELATVDEGLNLMLTSCRQNTNQWQPGNIWTKFEYFQRPQDFKILLVNSNYTVKEGEAAGCGAIITGPQGDCGGGPGSCSTAGTVCGLNDRWKGSSPGGEGGVYILVAKQSPEQWANPACRTFLRDGVRHEAEHVWFSNSGSLYFQHADGLGGANHPYCRGMQ